MNFGAGQTRANNVILSLNLSGRFTVSPFLLSGTTHLILDVNGYFAPDSGGTLSGSLAQSSPSSSGAPGGNDWLLLALTGVLCPAGLWTLRKRGLRG